MRYFLLFEGLDSTAAFLHTLNTLLFCPETHSSWRKIASFGLRIFGLSLFETTNDYVLQTQVKVIRKGVQSFRDQIKGSVKLYGLESSGVKVSVIPPH